VICTNVGATGQASLDAYRMNYFVLLDVDEFEQFMCGVAFDDPLQNLKAGNAQSDF
jgi:hypothetical protein